MKKFFSAAIFAVTAVMICGCVHKTEKADRNTSADTTTSDIEAFTETESVTESFNGDTAANANPTTASSSPYIIDNASVMDDNAVRECSDIISRLNSSRMINAAVVTVDKLDGTDPYDYAAGCYSKIFGEDRSRGLLFLINNDTGADILYKAGALSVDPNDEKLALYQATEDIVGGSYGSAAVRMLKLGENCTSHFFDNAGLFSSQQITELENAAAGYGKDISVYTVGNIAETSAETAEALCRRRYPAKDGVMLLIDCDGKTMAYSETDVPKELQVSAPDHPIAGVGELYTYLLDLLTVKRGT